MPLYDVRCMTCLITKERIISLAELDDPQVCSFCGSVAERVFPLEAALGYKPFEAFYAEPFDCDVHGYREWEQIKKSNGVEEKGDRAGLRLEEKSSHAVRIGPQAPVGRSWADVQRRKEGDKKKGEAIERISSPHTIGPETET